MIRTALNTQYPWSQYLLDGSKSLETRSYPLPNDLLGKEIAVWETGREGVEEAFVGSVVFDRCDEYRNKEEWISDQKSHLVDVHSEQFGWTEGERKFKWRVKGARTFVKNITPPPCRRRVRSIFSLDSPLLVQAAAEPTSDPKGISQSRL